MFAKICAIPDEQIVLYWTLLTSRPLAEVDLLEERLKNGAIQPQDAKRELAREIVASIHGEKGISAFTL